jgi:hypothetical protein
VVNPEDVSKKASINEGIVPLIIYGSVPIAEKRIHDSVTERKPSLLLIESIIVFREMLKKMTDKTIVIIDDQRKGNGDSL